MFRNRNNSQKPSDDLYANFKATFPAFQGGSRAPDAPSQSTTSLTDALDVAVSSRNFGEDHDVKDLDATPRGTNDQWRFTPSLLDPNSYAFSSFANQPPGYYTPTPGGTNTIYHNQAGDLHTPGFTLGLGTPLSMPTSEGPFNAAQAAHAPMHAYASTGIAPHVFHNPNPFPFHQQSTHHLEHLPQHSQPQEFGSHHYTHHHTTFDPYSQSHEGKNVSGMPSEMDLREHGSLLDGPPPTMEQALQRGAAVASVESFRYHVTLNAPTAMIKHSDEIPITYLNKGQAYSLSVIDTQPDQFQAPNAIYRTFVRISFEDDQQRQRPASCWQLWKEGRGTNEAHHRGGRLQAVEFVDPASAGTVDSSNRSRIELESASFDGFAFTWSPVAGAPAECAIAVRFNFLSTDFSHSKGVKGIPVRLCAKTELKTVQPDSTPTPSQSEICFCKVKLFRDHGAERKLSNDVAHVKKSIDKLKQQIAQVEAGLKDPNKRKRSGSVSKPPSGSRPGKVPKHKRTWSMSSDTSATGLHRSSQGDDLHNKLQALQDMFSSTRPASVLFLRGEPLDDPDLHPVQLSVTSADQTKLDGADQTSWTPQVSSATIISPTPSSTSLPPVSRRTSEMSRTAIHPPSRMTSNEWQNLSQTATGDLQPPGHQLTASPEVVKLSRHSSGLENWIDAVGVDRGYQPPPPRVVKPVACFYIRPTVQGVQPEDTYYRAIYLMQRTLRDLVQAICSKSNVEPSKVLRTLYVNNTKLEILVDDDFVLELPEGQDMVAEFSDVQIHQSLAPGWHSTNPEILVDGDITSTTNVQSSGYVLRLYY